MATFMSPIVPQDGYGNCAFGLASQLRNLGIDVINMKGVDGGPPRWAEKTQWYIDSDVVVLDVPPFWERVHAHRLAGFTMFESTQIPAEFVTYINECADHVLVPNSFCYRLFSSQTTVPVDIVPLGIDAKKYQPMSRVRLENRPYTFLWSGTPDTRKGWDLAYRSFRKAFGDREDVLLILHFRNQLVGSPEFADNNVEYVHGRISDSSWLDLLQLADAMVYPTRGEGHGMVPREAAATGLPVICTAWGGLEDCYQWALDVPAVGLVPATFGYFERGTIGEWAAPDEDAIICHMQWCVDNREAAELLGANASEFIRTRQDWLTCALELRRWMEVSGWL